MIGPLSLSYKPYLFSQRTVFFLTTNQRTVLSAIAFQPSKQEYGLSSSNEKSASRRLPAAGEGAYS
jgi:hypothetical protein